MVPNQYMPNTIKEMRNHLTQAEGHKVINEHDETECLVMQGLHICVM
jgi:hypothetical protein